MCVPEAEQVGQEIENMDNSNNSSSNNNNNNKVTRPLHCEVLHTQIEKWDKESPLMSSTDQFCLESSFPLRFQFLYHLFLLGFFQIINIYIYILKTILVETGFCVFVSSCDWWLMIDNGFLVFVFVNGFFFLMWIILAYLLIYFCLLLFEI